MFGSTAVAPSLVPYMDSPYQSKRAGVESEIECGSTYGLLMGGALALMIMRGVRVSLVSRPSWPRSRTDFCTGV